MSTVKDPFPEIFDRISGWEAHVASECADLIAGGAPLLWRDQLKSHKGEPTRDQVVGAVGTALSLLHARPFGGVSFGGRHWCTLPHVGCPGEDEQAPSGFDAGLGVGSVYTPRALADRVVAAALEPLVYAPGPRETHDRQAWRIRPAEDILALRVADIAAGSGAMLLAALRFLAERVAEAWERERGQRREGSEFEAARLIAANCLYGVDVNPLALEMAKLALCLVAYRDEREPDTLHGHFVAMDALTATGPEYQALSPQVTKMRGFDAVIGNPPWLGGHKITGEFGTDYRERLVKRIAGGLRGKADLCAYFVLRGWDLLHPRGQLTMICTNTITQGDTREVGLDQIVNEGGAFTWAIKSERWPTGAASVYYTAVSISKAPAAVGSLRTDLSEVG